MTDVRLIKLDVNSPTDRALDRIGSALHAGSLAESARGGIAIAECITQALAAGKRVLVLSPDGAQVRLIAD